MSVKINPSIFREYDIRGVYGRTLTEATARLLGRAFAELAREAGQREVLVGRDNRRSSPALAEALMRGLTEAGMDVVDLGQVVTPVLYWARIFYGVDPAIMVTASHNPPNENGFKLCLGPGSLYGEAIQDLYRRTLAASSLQPAARPGRARSCRLSSVWASGLARAGLNKTLGYTRGDHPRRPCSQLTGLQAARVRAGGRARAACCRQRFRANAGS